MIGIIFEGTKKATLEFYENDKKEEEKPKIII
jgi:hypothetical protein